MKKIRIMYLKEQVENYEPFDEQEQRVKKQFY